MDQGNHYKKCDLQVHSPRDRNWKGSNCVTEEERETYSKAFVKECRVAGVNAVAITDHHDMVFFEYIKAAAKAELDEDRKDRTSIKQRKKDRTSIKQSVQLPDLGENPDDQTVLQFALGREHAAMEQYAELAESTPEGAIRDLFSYLANEETKHKLELEKIYYQVVHSGGV